MRRFGAPAVTLSFLTIGAQTAINAAAGALKMPLTRYLPALAAGALVWGVIYATIGMAVFRSFWGSGSGVALLAALVALAVVALTTVVVRSRLARARAGDPGSASPAGAGAAPSQARHQNQHSRDQHEQADRGPEQRVAHHARPRRSRAPGPSR